MRIGYACLPLGISARTNHGFQLRSLSEERFIAAVDMNLANLLSILRYNIKNGILLFRISSDIIPFGSHPLMQFPWEELFKSRLGEITDFLKHNPIRVSMHPGQYTVLNSPDPAVVKKALADLEYHHRFLAALGAGNDGKLVIHTGGVYGNKKKAMARFRENFFYLSPGVQKRLVLENDEKSFTIADVLEISAALRIPAVFDHLHHQLNPPGDYPSPEEILPHVKATWGIDDGPVKIHYSEGDKEKRPGSHGKTVVVDQVLEFIKEAASLDPDIMLEVKDKDLSAIKVILARRDHVSAREKTDLWAKYKYTVMEKSYARYKECSQIINSGRPLTDFFRLVDLSLLAPAEIGSFMNATQHVWGYFKEQVTPKERQAFSTLCAGAADSGAVKSYLKRIAVKYPSDYINASYYFLY